MRPDLHEALNAVDDALFSGSYFREADGARTQLRQIMARWALRLGYLDAESIVSSIDFGGAHTGRQQTAVSHQAQEPHGVPTELDAALALARKLADDPEVQAQVDAACAEAKVERERFEQSRLIPRGLLDIPITGRIAAHDFGDRLPTITLGDVLRLCDRLDDCASRTPYSRDWEEKVSVAPNGNGHWKVLQPPGTDSGAEIAFIATANPVAVGILTATLRGLVAQIAAAPRPATSAVSEQVYWLRWPEESEAWALAQRLNHGWLFLGVVSHGRPRRGGVFNDRDLPTPETGEIVALSAPA